MKLWITATACNDLHGFGTAVHVTSLSSLIPVKLILSIRSNCVLTVINASAAVTLLEQRPEKIQALSRIRTHDLCDASAVLSQLSYQSHMRAVVYGLAQLGEHCTGIAEVVGSNPAQSLNFFRSLFK